MAPIHISNPEEYILQLLSGWDANDFNQALLHNKERLYENGFGVMIDGGGNARGRVYLPYAGCRNCSPYADQGTPTHGDAIKFGVSRNPAAWRREVQLIADKGNGPGTGLRWAWVAADGRSPVVNDPPYVPLVAYVEPVPFPPIVVPPTTDTPPPAEPDGDIAVRLDIVETLLRELLAKPAPKYSGTATYRGLTAAVTLEANK